MGNYSAQLINLVHPAPEQQQTIIHQSTDQLAVVVQSTLIEEQRSPITGKKADPIGSPDIPQYLSVPNRLGLVEPRTETSLLVSANDQIHYDHATVSDLIGVGLSKADGDNGIQGVIEDTSPKHYSQINGERRLKCDLCEKTFKRRDHLNKHVRSIIHTTERNFECEFCFKKYSSEAKLKQHVQNSHSLKMHQCEFCEKAFARRDHLTKHVQGVHLKERKFVCQHCNKSYTSHGALLQHIGKAHLEKNFSCQKCDRKFASGIRLQIHVQDTSLISNLFSCDICSERFRTMPLLLEHSVKSHKIKAWKCEICKGSFRGKYILQAHIKKLHHPR